MPLRIIKAALRDELADCCGDDKVDAVVERIVEQLGWRPPMTTLVDASDLDRLPVGSAVLVGNLTDPDRYVHVGMVGTHCVLFAGEDQPHPFHQPGLAPPLPCTVIWEPQEEVK